MFSNTCLLIFTSDQGVVGSELSHPLHAVLAQMVLPRCPVSLPVRVRVRVTSCWGGGRYSLAMSAPVLALLLAAQCWMSCDLSVP